MVTHPVAGYTEDSEIQGNPQLCDDFKANLGHTKLYLKKKKKEGECRDGSEVRDACCSPRVPRFNPQHPHGGSQPFVTQVP